MHGHSVRFVCSKTKSENVKVWGTRYSIFHSTRTRGSTPFRSPSSIQNISTFYLFYCIDPDPETLTWGPRPGSSWRLKGSWSNYIKNNSKCLSWSSQITTLARKLQFSKKLGFGLILTDRVAIPRFTQVFLYLAINPGERIYGHVVWV